MERSEKNFDLEQTSPQPIERAQGLYRKPELVFGRQAGAPGALARNLSRVAGTNTELYYLDAGEDGMSLVREEPRGGGPF